MNVWKPLCECSNVAVGADSDDQNHMQVISKAGDGVID